MPKLQHRKDRRRKKWNNKSIKNTSVFTHFSLKITIHKPVSHGDTRMIYTKYHIILISRISVTIDTSRMKATDETLQEMVTFTQYANCNTCITIHVSPYETSFTDQRRRQRRQRSVHIDDQISRVVH